MSRWFVRALLAVGAVVVADSLLRRLLSWWADAGHMWWRLPVDGGPLPWDLRLHGVLRDWGVPLVTAAVAVLVYHKLSRSSSPVCRETHCRKCGYILRGITEPRCPECGEKI